MARKRAKRLVASERRKGAPDFSLSEIQELTAHPQAERASRRLRKAWHVLAMRLSPGTKSVELALTLYLFLAGIPSEGHELANIDSESAHNDAESF